MNRQSRSGTLHGTEREPRLRLHTAGPAGSPWTARTPRISDHRRSEGCRQLRVERLLAAPAPVQPPETLERMATSSRFRAWPITEAAALESMLREMGLRVPASGEYLVPPFSPRLHTHLSVVHWLYAADPSRRRAEIDGTRPDGNGTCLSDAMCSVGPAGRGGTGSFISAEGLIITNHHVAADAVRQASAVDHDYANGAPH
eukprot:COSAG03_NODE_3_length_28214_cov_23.750987_16_plen_201_part_00